jgi:hypothetical protein
VNSHIFYAMMQDCGFTYILCFEVGLYIHIDFMLRSRAGLRWIFCYEAVLWIHVYFMLWSRTVDSRKPVFYVMRQDCGFTYILLWGRTVDSCIFYVMRQYCGFTHTLCYEAGLWIHVSLYFMLWGRTVDSRIYFVMRRDCGFTYILCYKAWEEFKYNFDIVSITCATQIEHLRTENDAFWVTVYKNIFVFVSRLAYWKHIFSAVQLNRNSYVYPEQQLV